MELGKSLRRRRPGGGKKSPPPKKRSGSSGWTGGRHLLVGAVTLLIGGGVGFLYATQVAYPAEDARVGDLVEVPEVRGGPELEAHTLLGERGLEVGRVDSILHPSIPAGEVVGQTPFPGQFALPGGAVELTVSLGPERRPVPDVTRLRADRALTVLQTTGFEVEVDSIDSDEPARRVVGTDPSAGTTTALPASILMQVSLGPPLVEMPDLVGRSEEEARNALEELGLTVGEVQSRFQFGFASGQVLATTPEAGEEVPRGGEVHLVVGTGSFLRDGGE